MARGARPCRPGSAAAIAKIAARAGHDADRLADVAKLSSQAKKGLRQEAADLWRQMTGRRAIRDKLEVHHRVPLEYAHLFQNAKPNRVANLVGGDPTVHQQISNAWGRWGRSLNGRTPSQAEVIQQAMRIDTQFGAAFKYPK